MRIRKETTGMQSYVLKAEGSKGAVVVDLGVYTSAGAKMRSRRAITRSIPSSSCPVASHRIIALFPCGWIPKMCELLQKAVQNWPHDRTPVSDGLSAEATAGVQSTEA